MKLMLIKKYFEDHNLSLVDDEYSECGSIQLSFLPHNLSNMVYNVRVGYNEKSVEINTVQKLLESALDISSVANEHFDRSDAVDEMNNANFINGVMPDVNPLSELELNNIEKCKKALGGGTIKSITELNDTENA